MTTEQAGWWTLAVLAVDFLIRVGLSARVILRRRSIGTTFAWLLLILPFPFVGAVTYLLFGELRLGEKATRRNEVIHGPYQRRLNELLQRFQVDWTERGVECEPMARLTEAAAGQPALPGNHLQLIAGAEKVFESLLAEIEAARTTCHLAFYIWADGGLADRVAEALLRASARGVTCRVLVDAVGSLQFLRGPRARALREGGVEVRVALPVNLVRALFVRFDLRMHRKIVVIDNDVAYTGSCNMVDPRYFKKGAGVGEWIDAMVRMRGPAVEGLALTFFEDWELSAPAFDAEIAASLPLVPDHEPPGETGDAIVQVAPSGPLVRPETIEAVILGAVYAARSELTLVTPYFVPGEALRVALASAALRGVDVTLIVPAKVDSRLVALANPPILAELVEFGVKVMLFQGGLLHTKAVQVDGEFSLFGSLNLDPRSFRLNFEITLAVYDRAFASDLNALLATYLSDSRPMRLEEWTGRSLPWRFATSVARLMSPLL
ncbi:MAG: cardiolipin synthase [Isosphaeraceae bacterium]